MTFLFTDIEGSTQRWEEHGGAMRDALHRHDDIMHQTIEAHGGTVFKTVGDAFCAVFTRPGDALAAAVDAQGVLGLEDFSAVGGMRVRMAIHTGSAHERGGDYFGPTLNRVARLLSIGHGGQILVSTAAKEHVQATMEAPASLSDLGLHRLKDLTHAERVYEIAGAGLPSEFPPLRSLPLRSNNLPLQTTSFVGRGREVAEIASLLTQHRVVTVLGPGGIGKTRATLEVAASVAQAYADGVWLAELAPLLHGGLIPAAIAAAVGAHLPPDVATLDAVIEAIGQKRLLLVLDNAEHLVEPVAAVASSLARACPNLALLVSSRQPLGIAAEATYRLPPLSAPLASEVTRLRASDALQYGAISLFVERARAQHDGFALTDDNAPAIAGVCARLDGIALAIELAAARMRMLTPERLRELLDERFRVLTGGRRDALPRQQTLRATIDWSYDLLDERERKVFRRAGTFVDGFTLEGACAVCGDEGAPLETFEAFDVMASLVDKSLVVAEPTDDATRFRLLESTRAYALDAMAREGEAEQTAARHLTFFRGLAERAEAAFEATGSESSVIETLAAELEDIRSALTWSLSAGDRTEGAVLIAAISRPWLRMGLSGEAIAQLDAFIAALESGGETRLLARLWTALAWQANSTFKSTLALDAGARAVACAGEAGDSATLARALLHYAVAAACTRAFDEAKSALDRADSLSGAGTTTADRLNSLETHALVALLSGELAEAAAAFDAQRDLLFASGDEYRRANATIGLAEAEHALGNSERAIALTQEILPDSERLLGREQRANILANLAGYLIATGDVDRARDAAREAVEGLAAADPGSVFVANALEHYALAQALDGKPEQAARLLGYCEHATRNAGYQREHTEQTTHDHLTRLLRERFGDDVDPLVARGAALTARQAVDEALAAAGSR